MEDVADRLVAMAGRKGNSKAARLFFLEQIEGEYNSLLWKCYLSHIAQDKDNCKKTERIAILGSSNIMPLKDMLKSVFHANDIDTQYCIGDYGNYLQELMLEDSQLYSFKPTITLLILSLADIITPVYEDPFSYSPQAIEDMLLKVSDGLSRALDRYSSKVIKNTTYVALMPAGTDLLGHIYYPAAGYRSSNLFQKLENHLRDKCEGRENVLFLDTRGIISKHPADKIEDSRFWYLARVRYTDLFFSEIAKELMRVYRMMNLPAKKCLILDLDNTLWGGVVGQDGMEGIVLGQDGLGEAFKDFQREILKLYKKGIMLAVCSKNNEADAVEVLEKHPQMLLKKDYFISQHINWDDKATNIKEIAKELNIGLEAMVFFDDDPAERKWVRDNLPQVTVPELPQDQFRYAEFLRKSRWFDSYRLSDEDLTRNATYKAITKTRHLAASCGNEEAFLKSLKQSVILERLNTSTISRAVQLTQKTNQFNLTTKRYQLSDLKEISAHKANHIYVIRVKDCFCDYGIMGLLILKDSEKDKEVFIDTFLLSCRIIGRKIERLILDWLKSTYKKKGFNRITALYLGTDKNTVCSRTYPDAGFLPDFEDKNESRYSFDLKKKLKVSPYSKLIGIAFAKC